MKRSPALDIRSVIVPEASTRAALAAIRSLGRHGCRISAGRSRPRCLGAASRFAKQVFAHPDPETDAAGFACAVLDYARRAGAGIVLPCSDVPTSALIDHWPIAENELHLLVPPMDALRRAHDKVQLADLARELHVPVPAGFVGRGDVSGDPRLDALGFPVVLKPRRSRYRVEAGWASAGVRIVGDREQLRRAVSDTPGLREQDFLVQEYVEGEGRGVFVLAKEGRIRCVFAHRRIREKPPAGGVSTLCQDAEPEPELARYAGRLITGLHWSGVAMVEFKWDPERRQAWLMEINGRFWGSMQLAVACGLDFPFLWYEQEVLGRATEPTARRSGVRLLWLLGDLDHFLIRLRHGGIAAVPGLLRDLSRTRAGCRLCLDTLQISDPRPFLMESVQWIRNVFGSA